MTERFIVLVIRTRPRIYRSRPGKLLLTSTLLVASELVEVWFFRPFA